MLVILVTLVILVILVILEKSHNNSNTDAVCLLSPSLSTSISCMLDTSCTVTGPNIIDVNNNVHIVKDRCAYSLLSTPSVPGFHVLANFRERRRKDVSFLDSVTLRLGGSGVDIHLEQGGRVRVSCPPPASVMCRLCPQVCDVSLSLAVTQLDDTVLSLDSLAQTFHGVELSKDPTGVTATRSVSNHTISVFFDGNTAQIIFKGTDDISRSDRAERMCEC